MPTPPQPDGSVDLSFIEKVAREIAERFGPDDYQTGLPLGETLAARLFGDDEDDAPLIVDGRALDLGVGHAEHTHAGGNGLLLNVDMDGDTQRNAADAALAERDAGKPAVLELSYGENREIAAFRIALPDLEEVGVEVLRLERGVKIPVLAFRDPLWSR